MKAPIALVPATRRLMGTGLPWIWLTWVTLVLALNITMSQISQLSGSVLDSRGQAWAIGELMGPSAWSSRQGWTADFGSDVTRAPALRFYLLFDVVFIGLYVLALRWVFTRRFADGRQRFLLGVVWVLLGVDLAEDLLAFVTTLVDAPAGLATALAVFSVTKSWLALLVILAALYGLLRRRQPWLRRLYEQLRTHRLSLVPLLVIGVVAIAPGADILDQVPDVQRRWTDSWGVFWREGGAALVALALLSVMLFVFGRARTQLAARNCVLPEVNSSPPPTTSGAAVRLWLLPPVLLVALAVLLAALRAPVEWGRVVAFCSLPVAIWIGSLVLRRLNARRSTPLWRPRPPQLRSQEELRRLMRLGDGLALGVLVVGALGVIRSVTAVVVLDATDPERSTNGYAAVLMLAGWLAAIASWPLFGAIYAWLTRALDEEPSSTAGRISTWLTPDCGAQRQPLTGRFPAYAAVGSVALFLALGVWPGTFASGGVLFAFVLGIAALTGIVTSAALLVQKSPPAELFQAIPFIRSTPVLTLLLTAVVFAGQVNARTPIHAVRSAASPPAGIISQARPDLPTAFGTWAAARPGTCGRAVVVNGKPGQVVPMVMVAAEGGGIRAAYWAVQSVQQLAADPCARGATMLSSGVSGGAVGLTVVRYNAEPTAVVTAMSTSRALALGLVGLMVRDFLYAATGVPLPNLNDDEPVRWADRAALMEDAWNEAADAESGWRDRSFAGAPRQPGQAAQPTAGAVVANSMSVGNACRVWVSDIALRAENEPVTEDSDGKIACTQPGASGLRSIDLLSAYGAPAPSVTGNDDPTRCLTELGASTAAMLAARFPYVTPSGRVGPCRRGERFSPADQLVDGGYLENTGLGTINDLADVWLPQVQAWNTDQLAAAQPKLVAPMIVYLTNDSGNDRRAPQRNITNEALVPPLAKLRADSGAVADDLLLQRSADLVQADRVCPPADRGCRSAVESLGTRTFAVYPASKPQVAAPLGWVLSKASRDAMDDAITGQANYRCNPMSQTESIENLVCARGHGSLGDLLAVVRTPQP